MKELILTGTFHFEQHPEALAEKEQEIDELVEQLAGFKPAKIAVEWEKTEQPGLSERYSDPRGEYAIDEIEQIGFRLAHKLNHDQLYAVNWTGSLTEEDMRKLNEPIPSHYPKILEKVTAFSEQEATIEPSTALIDSFKRLNDGQLLSDLEEMYMSFVEVENDGEPVGVAFLQKWVERELMIVKNIVELAEAPDERVLLLIGRDHVWMLKKLFEGMGWNVVLPFGE